MIPAGLYDNPPGEIIAWGDIHKLAGTHVGGAEESQAYNYDDYNSAPFADPCQ